MADCFVSRRFVGNLEIRMTKYIRKDSRWRGAGLVVVKFDDDKPIDTAVYEKLKTMRRVLFDMSISDWEKANINYVMIENRATDESDYEKILKEYHTDQS